MTYVKILLPTLKTHVVNLERDAKDLSRDLQRLEVRYKLGSKTLYPSTRPSRIPSHTGTLLDNIFAKKFFDHSRRREVVY